MINRLGRRNLANILETDGTKNLPNEFNVKNINIFYLNWAILNIIIKDKPFWIPVPRLRGDKFTPVKAGGNDIFIYWVVVVIPAEAGIQYL